MMNFKEAKQFLNKNGFILVEAQIENQDKAYQALMKLAHKVNDAGYKLYVVGGAVRDKLLGKTPNDYDLNTNMPGDEFLALSDPGTGRINHRQALKVCAVFFADITIMPYNSVDLPKQGGLMFFLIIV